MFCPGRIIAIPSGQFIVSKERILSNPKELYSDLYKYSIGSKRWKDDHLWQDKIGVSYKPGGPDEGHVGGAFFLEWIWHIIFGEDPMSRQRIVGH